MPDADATLLQDDSGRAVLRFERELAQSPQRVWRALTEPDELAAWHPTPFELEPALGTLRFRSGNWPAMPDGEIVEYDPPWVLAHTWDGDLLRWEIIPRDDACVLVLTHTFDDRLKAARDGAGWHLCLDALLASLAGAPTSTGSGDDQIPDGWRDLNDAYQRRFGITPEEATPPPVR